MAKRKKRLRPADRFEVLRKEFPDRVETRAYSEPVDLPRINCKSYPVEVCCPFCANMLRSSHNALNSVGATCSTCGCILYNKLAYMLWPPVMLVLERATALYEEMREGLRGRVLWNHPMAKLTDDQVATLRKEHAAGVRKATLAKKYGISQTHVGRLVNRKNR